MLKKYFSGLKFGLLLQIAVGPMCLMVFNTAKNVGFLVALSLVLAIALVDAFYITLASVGVSKLLEKENVKKVFKIIGSIVLIIFGINIILNVFGGFLGYLLFVAFSAIRGKLPRFMKSDGFLNFLVITIVVLIILYSMGINILELF